MVERRILSRKVEVAVHQANGSSRNSEGAISRLADSLKGQAEIQEWLALIREGYDTSVPLDKLLDRWRPFRSTGSETNSERYEYFVAPDGDDANPGTLDAPFATLKAARDALRKRRQQKGDSARPAGIFVRGGHYRMRSTLELGDQDSGRQSILLESLARHLQPP